jgi:hypothetical protein
MNALHFVCLLLPLPSQTPPAPEKDSHEALVAEMIQALGKAADVLETVKDKKTAAEARPRLREVGQSMQGLKKRSDKLGKPSPEKEAELKKKYKDKLEAQVKRLTEQAIRVGKVEGGKEALQELSGA